MKKKPKPRSRWVTVVHGCWNTNTFLPGINWRSCPAESHIQARVQVRRRK